MKLARVPLAGGLALGEATLRVMACTFLQGGKSFGLESYGNHDVILKVAADRGVDQNRNADGLGHRCEGAAQ